MSGNWVELADAPALAGLRFRGGAGASDYPAMAKLMNEVALDEEDEPVWTPTIFAHMDGSIPGFDPRRDRIIAEIDEEMIGSGRVQTERTIAGERVYYNVFNLAPKWRGHGIGRAVSRYNERRLRAMAKARPNDGPRVFKTFPVCDTNPRAGRLLRSEGYAADRYCCRMVRANLENIPELPLPAGIEIRAVGDEHVRAIWDAKEEAFCDLVGFARGTEEAFEKFKTDPYWRKDLTCIAWDGDEVVGTVFVFVGENQPKRAWTELITVRRPWRRRGIARGMIAECLRRLKADGLAEAVLGVDTQNPSGAFRIYEAMGYGVTNRATLYRKTMT